MTTSVPPVGELTSEQVESVRPAAGAGASWHDSRPWWLRCTPVAIELHAETTRAVSETGLEQRELLLACGGALFNLRAAVRFLGFEPAVRYLPDRRIPNLLAAVRSTTPQAPAPPIGRSARRSRTWATASTRLCRRRCRRPCPHGCVRRPKLSRPGWPPWPTWSNRPRPLIPVPRCSRGRRHLDRRCPHAIAGRSGAAADRAHRGSGPAGARHARTSSEPSRVARRRVVAAGGVPDRARDRHGIGLGSR